MFLYSQAPTNRMFLFDNLKSPVAHFCYVDAYVLRQLVLWQQFTAYVVEFCRFSQTFYIHFIVTDI